MLVILCVVAALLACTDAAKLSREQRETLQAKSFNNAWLLFTEKRTHYLLYRSVENDTAYGGFKPCVNMSLKRCWDDSMELWYDFYYQGIPTSDLYPEATMWIKMKENSQQKNLMSIDYDYYYGGYKDYTLLFTDYESCFTIQRDHDKAVQVWMIGTENTTGINKTCHSIYDENVKKADDSTEIPKYYIYNETICGKK